ncbi:cytochrome P450 [Amylocystis lapponica]|nr:cytochrome P450 [Amylocystis lapponica]
MLALNVLGILVALRISYVVFYRLVRSPLAKLPGPRISALTGLCLMYYEFTRRRRRWIHELHLKYGPIVRVAPDEVSFATWEAVKEIYVSGGSGYDKSSLYRLFDNFDTECMFSTTDKGPHAEIKKRFVDRYNKSFIMRSDVVSGLKERAEIFVSRCTEEAAASVNVYLYLHCYALDCITHHLFHPYGLKSLTESSDLATMKELSYQDSLRSSYILYYFPSLPPIAKRLILRGRRYSSKGLMSSYILRSVRRADVASDSVLHKLQMHKGQLGELAMASECMDHAVAGIDTTGDALCFLLHHLSLPSSLAIQEKLRHELVECAGDPIDDLPYLEAVVKEGLRCFTPIPMSLPRKVPHGGSVIDGVYLPEDTIVSCQAYTLHRFDTAVFPNPEDYVPERWLDSEGAMSRNQLFFTFATGGRGCIGKHVAILEMKLLLREVYSTYRTRVAADMKASMEMDDQIGSSRPKDQMCLLTFEKLVPL